MRKIIKISIAVFCTGVLLGGIGTGTAIAEYTSLEYTGQHMLGGENMKQETIDAVVTPVEGKKLKVSEYYRTTDIVYDDSVPVNTIRFRVSYNPELVSVRVRYEEEQHDGRDSEDEQRYQGNIRLYIMHLGSGYDVFMKNKDRILGELKQGKLGSYEMVSVDYVEIWINPQMKDWVEIDW